MRERILKVNQYVLPTNSHQVALDLLAEVIRCDIVTKFLLCLLEHLRQHLSDRGVRTGHDFSGTSRELDERFILDV